METGRVCIAALIVIGVSFSCVDAARRPVGSSNAEPVVSCPVNKTQCRGENGVKCIWSTWLCDGQADCADGEDEDPDMCSARQCLPSQVKCPNGRKCVDRKRFCDHRWLCEVDYETEKYDFEILRSLTCTEPCDARRKVRCDSGQCIDRYYFCNGRIACQDGSRDYSSCAPEKCGEGQVKCPATDQCINRRFNCDGRRDCSDGMDEDPAVCAQLRCDDKEVSCDNGQCMPKQRVCKVNEFESMLVFGRRWGCHDNSVNHNSPQCQSVQCDESEFRCRGEHRCVPDYFVCNGFPSCSDGSDEDQTMCANFVPRRIYDCADRAREAIQACIVPVDNFFNTLGTTEDHLQHYLLHTDSRQLCTMARQGFNCFRRALFDVFPDGSVDSCPDAERLHPYVNIAIPLVSSTLAYICDEHFDEFDRAKECLLEKNQAGERPKRAIYNACLQAMPDYYPSRDCLPREFFDCVKNSLSAPDRCGLQFVSVAEPLVLRAMQAYNVTICSQDESEPQAHPVHPRGVELDFLRMALKEFF